VHSNAFCVPPSRSFKVSARVSRPASAGTPQRTSAASSVSSARQFEGGFISRINSPAAWIRPDSQSSRLNPVLPISGIVMVTICPA